ncbi:MAG TPA: hypothetical protein VN736_24930 [Candidatus Limnocylindrales bacterium]|nr:hypothetical protein [Candidatus Limnocylindrales bacterium]
MKFVSKYLPVVIFGAASTLLCAQTQTSVTQILPVPDGGQFYVDGQYFQHGTSVVWPAGSSHTLYAVPQGTPSTGVQYVFGGWEAGGTQLPGNPVFITADPTLKVIKAAFQVQFNLNLVFFNCSAAPCNGPGTVLVNGTSYSSDTQLWVPAGGAVTVQAIPADGYVFAGWGPGSFQAISGNTNVVTVTAPTSVYPLFKSARPITLATEPSSLQLLADQALVTAPVTLQWGYGTVHNLAPVSPQNDIQGTPWVFSSWSNGGASLQSYTVASLPSPETITATFVPGAPIDISTVPAGLSLTVDGRSNWSSYNFLWGVGQSHTLAAPAQQTDSHGGTWSFSGWSDGGAASHTYTVAKSAAKVGDHLVATYTPVGHLTVNSTVAGLPVTVDGQACAAPCDILRPVGTTVSVLVPQSVPAGTGSRQDFAGWSSGASSASLSIPLDATPVVLNANYHLMNLLATAAAPDGAASWSLTPNSPDGFYDSQATVAVRVTPLPGFRFRSFGGDLSGTAPAGNVTMAAPRAVQAIFDKVAYVSDSGAVNGAGVTPSASVAPGSIVSLFGANLTSDTAAGPSAALPQTLAGTAIRMGDRILPLFFVSPTQINFQLPTDMPLGKAVLTVSSQGQPDVQASATVSQDAPGLFQQVVNGQSFAVAVHADGSPVSAAAPAQPGETITLYATGCGQTSPARPEGFPVPQAPAYVLQDGVSVSFAGESMDPVSAVAAAGAIGVDAVQVTVPADAASGMNVQVVLTVGGQQSNTVLLPIQ